MGVNLSTKTKNGNTIIFNDKPFSEGSSRYCFLGQVQKGPDKGILTVIKTYKNRPLRKNQINAQLQLKVYGLANDYACMFNEILRQKGYKKGLHFPQPDLIQVSQLSISSLYQHQYFHFGDYICAERYLHGKYKKWTNNTGFSTKNETMEAFQHFTYIKSGKLGICCDLQGVQTNRKYILTDPAVNSISQEFGNTDIGQKGIKQIMSRHQCNKICYAIGLNINSNFNKNLKPVWNSTSQRRSHAFGI